MHGRRMGEERRRAPTARKLKEGRLEGAAAAAAPAAVSAGVVARRRSLVFSSELTLLAFWGVRRMTAAYLDTQPHLLGVWSDLNPLGRIGRPDELRGVVTWLASDASSFCTGSE